MSNEANVWRVQANDQFYETDLHTLKVWVCEGAVLATDKVAKGSLHWIDAGRVPVLRGVFSGAETLEQVLAAAPPVTETPPVTPAPEVTPEQPAAFVMADAPPDAPQHAPAQSHDPTVCYQHPNTPPRYVCRVCQTYSCRDCVRFTGNVPLCPVCGDLCRDAAQVQQQQRMQAHRATGFGAGDLSFALQYPLRNAVTLLGAAAIYGMLTLIGLKGRLLALGLMFGFITRVIQQVSMKGDESGGLFSNHDFMFYDDVIAPLGRGLCVTIVTYGPAVLLAGLLIMGFIGSLPDSGLQAREEQRVQSEAAQKFETLVKANAEGRGEAAERVTPGTPGQEVDVLLDPEGDSAKQAEIMQRYDPMHAREYGATPTPTPARSLSQGVFGDYAPLAQSLSLSVGLVLLLLGALFWALFSYPMALLIAGFTQNAGAVLNPLVGFDTLRYLGTDYLKAFGIYILLLLISGVASGVAVTILAPFELPMVGNLPARLADGVITFYANMVLACTLGLLLYKCGDRLNLGKA